MMNTSAVDQATILVIDKDAITLTAIAAVLDMNGYECHCARDWEAAMKAARTLSLDLIVCDIDLGNDKGLELCSDLREIESTRGIPFVLLSNNAEPNIDRIAQNVGAAYFLHKPFEPSMLIELVGNALWMPHLVNNRMEHDAHTQQKPQRRSQETKSKK